MRDCFDLFLELTGNEELPLEKIQEDIEEAENDFHENTRITLYDNQANLELEFFNEFEEFDEDNKDAEELFLAVEEINDNSS